MTLGVSRLRDPAAKWTFLSVIVVIALTAAIRVPLLDIPFERDEGEYAYIAWRLGHHELPYRDWVDQKPPGVFWVYRLALNLPLNPIRSVHGVGLLFAVASAGALFFLARRFMGRPWAAIAAALFAILLTDPLVQGTTANTELFMLLPLILSQLAFFSATTDSRQRIPFALLSGVLTGIAVAFKQVAAVNGFLLIVLYPLFVPGEKRLRNTLSFAGWSVAGAAVVWGLIAIYFYLHQGLAALVENVFTHNLEYINAMPWPARLLLCDRTLAVLARSQALVWLLAAAGFIALYRTGKIKLLFFLAGWLGTSLVGISASGNFYPHYFQQMLPALALLATFGAEALSAARFWQAVPTWGRATVVAVMLAVLPAVVIYPYLFAYSPAEAIRKMYPGNYFAEMPELARRIARATAPNDRLFVFGSEAELLFYAQRASATRYIFLFPLYGPYRDIREKQMAAAEEISRNRPAAAAAYLPNDLFSMPGSEQFFTQWSRSYLRENFRVVEYLTLNEDGSIRINTGTDDQEPPFPRGQYIVGVTFLKRTGSADESR
jgi:hypothetical protein